MVQTPYRYYDIPDEYLDPWYIPYVNQSNQVDADVHLLYQRVDNIVGTIGTVGAPGDLRQVVGVNGAMALARGFSADADGGGGMFFWLLGSATDDGGTIIVPVGSPPGFWRRLTDGTTFSLRWYGASSSTPDCSGLLLALLTTIGSAPATIVLPNERGATSTPYTFLADVAIPSHVRVRFEPGARLHIDDGVTVTWAHADQIDAAPNQRIFSFAGSGALRFTGGGTTYLPWTGAAGNGSTDDTTALTALVTALDGTAGTIQLPTPSVAYRFSTGTTWTMSDGTKLIIAGDHPRTPIQVNAQLWFFSEEARAATTLAANATRGAISITLTAATGIQEGDVVWIYTGVVAETGWGTFKTDTHLVRSVAGNTVTLESPLNFSYATSDDGQSVTIYRPAQVILRHIDAEFYSATTRFLFRGTRYSRFENVRFFDASRAQDLTPAEWSRCVDTTYDGFEAEGMNYSTAVNFCRNFTAQNVIVTQCIASIEAASFSDGVRVNTLYSYGCDNSVGSHPAFNVHFENVEANDVENTGSIRAAGVTLRNARLHSTVAANTGAVLISTIEFVDPSLYDDYDTTLDRVTWDFPNWEYSTDLDDTVLVSYGRKLTVHDCAMPGLNCSTLNKPFDIFVSSSRMNKAQFRSHTRVVNTRFESDGAAGTWALYLYGSIPWLFTNCHFKGYETLLYRPVNKLHAFTFVGCFFESITGDVMDPFYPDDEHYLHFTDCSFYLCSMTWNDPEVVNALLRVTNCHFRTSTTQLDFATHGIASGKFTGGVVDGTPFFWQNPFSHRIIVDRVLIEVTTAGGTAGSVMNIDVVQTNGSTGDDVLDGIDLNPGTVPVIYDSLNDADAGTNGKKRAIRMDGKGGDYDWITGRVLVADSTSLVAKYYIYYHRL